MTEPLTDKGRLFMLLKSFDIPFILGPGKGTLCQKVDEGEILVENIGASPKVGGYSFYVVWKFDGGGKFLEMVIAE